MTKLKDILWKRPQILILPALAMLLNGMVYYGGKVLSVSRPSMDMTMEIDRMTPFVPWTILIYFGCYLFWTIVYVWMAAGPQDEVKHFYYMHTIGELICFPFFVWLPTTNVRPIVTGTDIWSSLVRLQYTIDTADNLFPSIHCMISWICWIGLRNKKDCPQWCRNLALLCALAVCVSTLTVKQHVIMDVAGSVLAAEGANQLAKLLVIEKRKNAEKTYS